MGTKNDTRILKLREKIQEKKDDLAARKVRFAPVTHCSLEMDGVRYNLNVLGASDLKLLACKIHALQTAATALSFDDVLVTGFSLEDWMTDIKSRIEILAAKVEEAQLKSMEKTLAALLSSDKKTELELDAIERML